MNWGPVSEWVLAGLFVADSIVVYLIDKKRHEQPKLSKGQYYCPECGVRRPSESHAPQCTWRFNQKLERFYEEEKIGKK